jgi:predicted transposase YdaD
MNLSPVYEKWRQETLQEGRQEGERSLVLRQLSYRIGTLSTQILSSIEALSLPKLEMLGEELLDFTNV